MEYKDRIIEITTQGSYDLYKKYYMFSLFRGKYYKQGPILTFIVAIAGIIVALTSGISFGFEVVDITVLIILTLMIILMLFLIFVLPKLYYKSARNFAESTNKYRFTDEYMLVESSSNLTKGSSQIEYSALHKVLEIDEMILIYISSSQAFVIPKKDCFSGDIQYLQKLLKSKVKKYKNYCKKKC